MLRSASSPPGPKTSRIVSDVANPTAATRSPRATGSRPRSRESTFEVRPLGPLYGVLHRWEFASSPIAVIDVTAAHNPLVHRRHAQLDTRAIKTGDELAAFSRRRPTSCSPRRPTRSSTTRPCSRPTPGVGARRRRRPRCRSPSTPSPPPRSSTRAAQGRRVPRRVHRRSRCCSPPGARSASRSTTASTGEPQWSIVTAARRSRSRPARARRHAPPPRASPTSRSTSSRSSTAASTRRRGRAVHARPRRDDQPRRLDRDPAQVARPRVARGASRGIRSLWGYGVRVSRSAISARRALYASSSASPVRSACRSQALRLLLVAAAPLDRRP